MKSCARCNQELDEKMFNKKRNSLSAYCKKCNSEYLKEHYRKNKDYYATKRRNRQKSRREIIRSLKGFPCFDCGSLYPPEVMDFDHIGDKKYNISSMKTNSLETILSEVEKCDLVCANCHRIRTLKRRQEFKSLGGNHYETNSRIIS